MKKTLITMALLVATGAWAQASQFEQEQQERRHQTEHRVIPREAVRPTPRIEHRVRPEAQRRDHRYNNYDRHRRPHRDAIWHDRDGWILPAAIFGGLLTYSIMSSQPQTVIVERSVPEAIYVAPAFVAPNGYRYIQAYDESCPCWKQVLVPIN